MGGKEGPFVAAREQCGRLNITSSEDKIDLEVASKEINGITKSAEAEQKEDDAAAIYL